MKPNKTTSQTQPVRPRSKAVCCDTFQRSPGGQRPAALSLPLNNELSVLQSEGNQPVGHAHQPQEQVRPCSWEVKLRRHALWAAARSHTRSCLYVYVWGCEPRKERTYPPTSGLPSTHVHSSSVCLSVIPNQKAFQWPLGRRSHRKVWEQTHTHRKCSLQD